jgi:hypothetical protein
MAKFKMADLMVLLQPGWADQTVGQGQVHPAVSPRPPVCGGSNHPDICGGSNYPDICEASQLVKNLGCVPLEQLDVLKQQLCETLEAIARREYELRQKTQPVEAMDSAKLDALAGALKRVPSARSK